MKIAKGIGRRSYIQYVEIKIKAGLRKQSELDMRVIKFHQATLISRTSLRRCVATGLGAYPVPARPLIECLTALDKQVMIATVSIALEFKYPCVQRSIICIPNFEC